jgi:hypothetical protein
VRAKRGQSEGKVRAKHIMAKHILAKHILAKQILAKHIMAKHILAKHIRDVLVHPFEPQLHVTVFGVSIAFLSLN